MEAPASWLAADLLDMISANNTLLAGVGAPCSQCKSGALACNHAIHVDLPS